MGILNSAQRILDEQMEREYTAIIAKAMVAAAFRNGPIEDIHAAPENRISQDEMKAMMKHAVDEMYALLLLWHKEPEAFAEYVLYMRNGYTYAWDEPENTEQIMEQMRKLPALFASHKARQREATE